jgi:cytoskeletal protein CcmA (bactofilin family)
MFQKKEIMTNFDIIIGPNSTIKGDIESEGSIRVDGRIIGNVTSLGSVIISENANVTGNIISQNADIYGKCEGNVHVKGKINIHQNSSLIGDIIAKSFNTKEGSLFKGNCVVDPAEELIIPIEPADNLLDFTKSNALNNHQSDKNHTDSNRYHDRNKNKNKESHQDQNAKSI